MRSNEDNYVLKEEQLVTEILMSFTVDRLSDEESELVSVLARSRDTDSTLPVVVQVTQFEREL